MFIRMHCCNYSHAPSNGTGGDWICIPHFPSFVRHTRFQTRRFIAQYTDSVIEHWHCSNLSALQNDKYRIIADGTRWKNREFCPNSKSLNCICNLLPQMLTLFYSCKKLDLDCWRLSERCNTFCFTFSAKMLNFSDHVYAAFTYLTGGRYVTLSSLAWAAGCYVRSSRSPRRCCGFLP